MSLIISSIHGFLIAFGPVVILLGLLIFVHELGHFLVAKFCGVRVEVFSLGFGKRIFNYKRGDTNYCISIFPIGGYVKMFGDDPSADVPDVDKPYAFLHKRLPQRTAIVLAGPLMNLVFAALLFVVIAWHGEEVPSPYVGDVAVASQAYKDGFRSGDHVLKINDEATPTWIQVDDTVRDSRGQELKFTVQHEGETQPTTITAAVETEKNDNIFSFKSRIGAIKGLTQASRSTVVGVSDRKSPAGKAGLQPLDLITKIDGKKVSYWRNLNADLVAAVKDQKEITLQVSTVDDSENPKNIRTLKIPIEEGWASQKDMLATLGLESAELYIYQVGKNTPAAKAGIQAKDKILKVDDQPVHSWTDIVDHVKKFDPSARTMKFTVSRDNRELTFNIAPHLTAMPMSLKGQQPKRYTIGIISGFFPVGADPIYYAPKGVSGILSQGMSETYRWCEIVTMTFVRLVEGDVSARNLGGVITIGRVASHSFAAGLDAFLRTMGFISINLFLINLFPIPVLDGGHLLFYVIEALQGAPLSLRKMEIAQQIGLTLLMFLMVFALYNDIANLFISKPW